MSTPPPFKNERPPIPRPSATMWPPPAPRKYSYAFITVQILVLLVSLFFYFIGYISADEFNYMPLYLMLLVIFLVCIFFSFKLFPKHRTAGWLLCVAELIIAYATFGLLSIVLLFKGFKFAIENQETIEKIENLKDSILPDAVSMIKDLPL